MQIIVLATPEGRTETLVKGRAGPSCVSDSEFLTNALGIITQDVHTEEYDGLQLYDAVTNQQMQVHQNVNRIV